MVGLPARGKTYIAHKAARYLNWLGIRTRVFNVGNYRRKNVGAEQLHDFFDPKNDAAKEQRRLAAVEALKDMLKWLDAEEECAEESKSCVAIYDATNSNYERRKILEEACLLAGVRTLYIESLCDNEEIITTNIREVKLNSPDYANMDPEQAVLDFRQRIHHYEEAYQTLSDDEGLAYVKLIDAGARTIVKGVTEYLQSRIINYLMNIHIKPRSIYIARHGESEFNRQGRIGGDSNLSRNGRQFAEALPRLLDMHLVDEALTVWTSSMKRTIQTAEYLRFPKLHWKALDELDAGVCDGLTYEEIEAKYPEDFAARDQDKFNYRYRGGESYGDLVLRLEPIIMELERQENILIIGHQAILRAIYGYALNLTHEELPYVQIPLHMIIKLTPHAYGCKVEKYQLEIEAVDTYRPRPKE